MYAFIRINMWKPVIWRKSGIWLFSDFTFLELHQSQCVWWSEYKRFHEDLHYEILFVYESRWKCHFFESTKSTRHALILQAPQYATHMHPFLLLLRHQNLDRTSTTWEIKSWCFIHLCCFCHASAFLPSRTYDPDVSEFQPVKRLTWCETEFFHFSHSLGGMISSIKVQNGGWPLIKVSTQSLSILLTAIYL